MSRHAVLVLALAAATLASCSSDPVRDRAIEELGPEDPGAPEGPDHRPGQPCLLCHSSGGPASGSPFAVAGTVYQSANDDADGADGVEVRFIDATNGAPADKVTTSKSGNFYVPTSAWKLTFPFRVALFRNGAEAARMITTVNREGSCNYCHRPAKVPSSLSDQERVRRFYPQITAGGGT